MNTENIYNTSMMKLMRENRFGLFPSDPKIVKKEPNFRKIDGSEVGISRKRGF